MKRVFVCLLALCLLLTGCAGKTTGKDLMEDRENPEEKKEWIAIGQDVPETFDPETDESWENALIADFGIRLFREAFREGENTLISPMSVLTALAMTANGAEGETLAQMEAVLGQSTGALNSWYKYGARYDDSLLHLANGIWFRENASFIPNQAFLQTNADYFGAGLYEAPFDNTTLQEINRFVEENTGGMIKDMLKEIPSDEVMYLVNALALDARWEETYTGGDVNPATFTKTDGTSQDMELMWSEESLYYENDLCTGFQKPYESKGRLAFVAVLPKEGVTIEALLAGLEEMGLQHFLASDQKETVEAALPKFEADSDIQMVELLKAMGMTDAFDSARADLSGLGTSEAGNIYLSQVIHKTFISVAEKGTKAGAATVVAAAEECAMEEVKRVVLNRPFLYMIVDTESNTPVFMGVQMDMA